MEEIGTVDVVRTKLCMQPMYAKMCSLARLHLANVFLTANYSQ